MNQIRLNKYLSQCGISSRRKAEEFILQGRILVNEKIAGSLSFRVDPERDVVRLDGEKISPRKNVYLLLNKPKRIVSTTSDEKHRVTVVDLIKNPDRSEKIFPVGRLDYDTTGVIFLTNDGEFSNLLTHPKNKVPRVYEARLNRALEEKDKEKLLNGITVKPYSFRGIPPQDRKARFIKIFSKNNDRKFVEVTCIEGRNHFVKNLFGTLGYRVIALNRLSFAGITADVKTGSYRHLSKTEVDKLKEKYAE
ncbi:MAG: pseudouridine synthase [Ignavibacteria bacterium]